MFKLLFSFFLFSIAPCVFAQTHAPVLTFQSLQNDIFQAKCFRCHSGDTAKGDVTLDNYEKLMAYPREAVIAGTPDESGIVISVERDNTDEKRMPPPPKPGEQLPPHPKPWQTPLTAVEKAKLRQWIQEGAKKQ